MANRPWIVYTRVSTDDQVEGVSLSAQQAALEGMLTAKGAQWEVVSDEGLSAMSLRRPGLQRILQRIDAGELGGVAVWKIDRLSRRLRELLELVERMQRAGCELLSLTEMIDTSGPMGRFQLALMGALGQLESERTGERVQMAMRHMKAQGYWTGGPIPAGCKVEGERGARRLVRDEAVAPLVEPIWQQVIDGATLAEVGAYLQRVGVTSGTNRRWSKMGVRGLLLREAVVGVLVSAATFARCREALGARWAPSKASGTTTTRKGRSERVWPLQGVARCGRCGSVLVGVHGGKGGLPYLRCSGRVRFGRDHCGQRDLPAATYEAAVVEAVVHAAESGDVLRHLETEAARLAELAQQQEPARRSLERRRDRARALVDRVATMVIDADDAAARALRPRLTEAQTELEAVEHELARMDGARRAQVMTGDQLRSAAALLAAGLRGLPGAPPASQARILQGLLRSVAISDERLQLELAVLPETKQAASEGGLVAGSYPSKEWLPSPYCIRPLLISVSLVLGVGPKGARLVRAGLPADLGAWRGLPLAELRARLGISQSTAMRIRTGRVGDARLAELVGQARQL